MSELGVGTAILSVSTPGTTFLPNPADAAALARDLNEYLAAVVAARAAIERTNALAPFPRLGAAAPPDAGSALDQVRHAASSVLMRGVARLINTG
jgi:hypothetical protein